LERPANATSIPAVGGQVRSAGALIKKLVCLRRLSIFDIGLQYSWLLIGLQWQGFCAFVF